MDNHHVHISSSGMSCGVLELSGITAEPEKVLYALASHLYHPARGTPAAFVIWSDVVPDSNGHKLSRFLNTTWAGMPALCYVTMSKVRENPKTSNPIAIFTWAIPHVAFKAWYVKERVKRAKKL